MFEVLKALYRYLFRANHQNHYLNKKALSYFEECTDILDVGCGIGSFVQLDPERIEGIDSNPETVEACSQRGLFVRHGRATDLPYDDESLDGVHCSHVIEHMQPKHAYVFLHEVSRVLITGGIFVLRTPILWDGFYNNLTHIKPYNPDAIMRYMVYTSPDTTFPQLPHRFEKVDLQWRYRPIMNFLYPFGVHRLKKDAYMLVLRKVS